MCLPAGQDSHYIIWLITFDTHGTVIKITLRFLKENTHTHTHIKKTKNSASAEITCFEDQDIQCLSPDRLSWWSALVIGWWLFWQRRPASADQSENRRWLMNAFQSVIFYIRLSLFLVIIVMKGSVAFRLQLFSCDESHFLWPVIMSHSNTLKHTQTRKLCNNSGGAKECGLILLLKCACRAAQFGQLVLIL